MRKTFLAVAIGLLTVMVSGCGAIPEMTDEQNEMVSEYAAALMLKYDSENHSRLVPVEDYILQYNEQLAANQQAADDYISKLEKEQEELKKEEEERREETMKQEQASANNGVSSGDNTDSSFVGSETVIIVDNGQNFDDITSIADFVDADLFDIQYAGYSVSDSYGDTKDFTYPVHKGKKLLILQFDVKNLSSNSNDFDIMQSMTSFKCSVNDGGYISVGVDMEPTNLAYAAGDMFAAGETKQYVLIGEIDENIEPATLYLKLESATKKSIVKILK